jgi:hypothetical protein
MRPVRRHDIINDAPRSASRRDVLRIGGLSVATATIISACVEHQRGQIGRVGAVPTTAKLPDAAVTNVTLLRTASSLEHSIINVYNQIIGKSNLLDPKYNDMFTRFRDDHVADAKVFEALTTAAGGTAWTCGNPKLDDVIMNPALDRITKATPATSTSKAIKPSDDPRRDMLNFAHGLESMGAATQQALVALFTDPALRSKAMTVGAREGRHAALLALTINPDRPGGLVNFADAVNAQPASPPTTAAATTTTQNIAAPAAGGKPAAAVQLTEIPSLTAIPSQFGGLAATQIVVGAGDENGTRLKLNLETPSLNSFTYEYMKPSC